MKYNKYKKYKKLLGMYRRITIGDQNIVAIYNKFYSPSNNSKVGDAISQYVINADMHPYEAYTNGGDRVYCNCCGMHEWCYVNRVYSVSKIFKAFQENKYDNYQIMTDRALKYYFGKKPLRLGAIGNTSVLPFEEVDKMVSYTPLVLSYIHDWSIVDPIWSKFCMASVESLKGYHQAKLKGYRTYRVIADESEVIKGYEILCPYTSTGRQCVKCGLCNGNMTKGKDIAIVVHGTKAKVKAWKEHYYKLMEENNG